MATGDAWIDPSKTVTRSIEAAHRVTDGYFDISATGEFATGSGLPGKLGIRNCMRVTASLFNISGQPLYDVRWLVSQEDLDLWHLYFVNPSGYTDLFEGDGTRNPYRTFMTKESPDLRIFPHDMLGEEHIMFVIGTDVDFNPLDPGNIVEIRTTIDATVVPSANEPVGIFMGVPPDQKVVIRVGETSLNPVHDYWVMDHDSNWDDISITIDPDFDFPAGNGIYADISWVSQPAGPHAWAQSEVIFHFDDIYPGGLYEIPLILTDQTEQDDFIGPNFFSDAIDQTQYFYFFNTPDLLASAPGPVGEIMPVATSPIFRDINNSGTSEFIAVYKDQVVTLLEQVGNDFNLAWNNEWIPDYPVVPLDRKLYCLGSVALSDQNLDGIEDIIVCFAMIADWGGLQNVCEGRIYCIDGDHGTTIWYKDYAGGLGDIVASPIIIDIPGDNREEVIVMLDRPAIDQPHIEVLRWGGGSLTDVSVIREIDVMEGLNRSEGIRANGALIHPDYTGGDIWLTVVSAGHTPLRQAYDHNYIHIYNLTPGNPVEVCVSSQIAEDLASTHPADVLNMDFVHVGIVTGDVDGDGQYEIIAPRRRTLRIYEDSLASYTDIPYGGIDADQLLDLPGEPSTLTTLSSVSDAYACRNVASLPSLGDMNHDGKPDIVLALESWVFALTYDELDFNPEKSGKFPCYDSIWTFYCPDALFWSHPVLIDSTRDGFLDVIVSAGGNHGPGFNLLAIDGSPANNHHFGVPDRLLWNNNDFLQFQAIGQGPAACNAFNDGWETVHVGSVWSQYVAPVSSTYGLYNSRYAGHGTKELYPPPPSNLDSEPAWARYLADHRNTACYLYEP